MFTVRKKNGDQRLIIDGRLANLAFSDPDHVELASGESFSRLEASKQCAPEVAEADIEVAFYAIAMPDWVSEFFGFESVRAG
eukprot:10988409-Karenia_brevis.AAC.1